MSEHEHENLRSGICEAIPPAGQAILQGSVVRAHRTSNRACGTGCGGSAERRMWLNFESTELQRLQGADGQAAGLAKWSASKGSGPGHPLSRSAPASSFPRSTSGTGKGRKPCAGSGGLGSSSAACAEENTIGFFCMPVQRVKGRMAFVLFSLFAVLSPRIVTRPWPLPHRELFAESAEPQLSVPFPSTPNREAMPGG